MIGEILSHYRIVDKLGEGGMGKVYLAEDTQLKRRVALKVLPTEVASDPKRLARFQREAETVAALKHANIVTIYSVEEDDGRHFLTMELVEGTTLDRHIPAGGLGLAKLFDLAIPIADALAEAHARGFTHRDLKPANVMVNTKGLVKVLDFGLAKLADGEEQVEDDAATEALTLEGLVVGTAHYMSPEQAKGEPADHRSDVFSLGVVLYEMATGTRPFRGTSSAELLSSLLKDEPPPVTVVRSELPNHLGRVVQRCLEKEPDRRYQNALDVRNELEGLKREFDSRASLGDAPAVPETVRPVVNRKAVLAAILGLVAAVVFGWWTVRDREETAQSGAAGSLGTEREMIVVLPFDNQGAPEDEYFAAGMSDEISSRLAKVSDFGVIAQRSAATYAGTDKTHRQIAEELGVDYILEGTIRWAKRPDGSSRVRISPELVRVADNTQLWGESLDRAIEDVLDLQSEIASRVARELGAVLGSGGDVSAARVDPIAFQLYLKGRHFWFKRTPESLDRALDYYEQALGRDPEFALAHAGLAETYVLQGAFSQPPTEVAPKAKAAAKRALEIDDSIAEAHAALAYTATLFDYDWQFAQESFERALALKPSFATGRFWYAAHLAARGRIERAIAEAKRAQELDPVSPIITAGVAWTYHYARQHERVVEQALQTLEIDPAFPIGHLRLAVAYKHQSRFQEAIAHLEEALESSSGSSDIIGELGHTYAVAGRTEEAERILQRLAALEQEHYVSAYDRSRIYAALGNDEVAFSWLEKAYEERAWYLAFVNVEPDFDILRTDPRFNRLVLRLGLTP